MKKSNQKKLFAKAFATLFTAITLLSPLEVFAYNAYEELPKETTVNDVTYYDIYGGKQKDRVDASDNIAFYTDVLKNEGLLEKWSGLAYSIFKGTEHSYKDHSGKGFDKAFGEGHYFDLVDTFLNKNAKTKSANSNNGGDTYMSSGLSAAENFNQVEVAMGNQVATLINRNTNHEHLEKFAPIPALNSEDEKTILYTIASNVDQHGGTFKTTYNSFGIAFYDFKVALIVDDQPISSAIGDMTTKEAIQNNPVGFSYDEDSEKTLDHKENDTGKDATSSRTLGSETTQTITNTIANSESYSFTETVSNGIKYSAKAGFPKVGEAGMEMDIRYDFGATAAVESTVTKAEALTKTYNSQSSIAVTMPAYTALDTITETTTATMKTGYDQPLAISYKVMIFSKNGDVYDDNAAVCDFTNYSQYSFSTEFGAKKDSDDAVINLNNRLHPNTSIGNYETTYGKTTLNKCKGSASGTHETTVKTELLSSALDWNAIKKGNVKGAHSALGGAATIADSIFAKRPMSVTGATMSELVETTNMKLSNLIALYPIKSVKAEYERLLYKDVIVGNTIALHPIHLQAFNEKNVEYYGFGKRNGIWKLVDENDAPLDESIATLKSDQENYNYVVTAKGEGTAYAKYEILEDKYSWYGAKEGEYSTNQDLSLPMVEIRIAPEEEIAFDGTVEATGKADILVNDEPIHIDDIETITAAVYDKTDKEMAVPVTWTVREVIKPDKGGLIVNENYMYATNVGVYHIRAEYKDAYSAWLPVTVLPKEGEPLEVTSLTRGDIALVLYYLSNQESVTGNSGFADIDTNNIGSGIYYKNAVLWALQNNVLDGYSSSEFKIDGEITKEQFIDIMYRFAEYKGIDTSVEMAPQINQLIVENGVSPRLEKAVEWALSKGWITDADLAKLKEPATTKDLTGLAKPVLREPTNEQSSVYKTNDDTSEGTAATSTDTITEAVVTPTVTPNS